MILTLLAYVVGGHTFAVPSPLTPVTGLQFPLNLRDVNGVRPIGRVRTAGGGAGALGVLQCSPDGSTWTTMVTVSLGTAGDVTASLQGGGVTDYQAIPTTCRTDAAKVRAALQGGSGGNVVVDYLAFEFVR